MRFVSIEVQFTSDKNVSLRFYLYKGAKNCIIQQHVYRIFTALCHFSAN